MMFIYTLPLLVKYRAIMVIDILSLLEKESGHGQRHPSSSGKGGGVASHGPRDAYDHDDHFLFPIE